MAKGQAVWNSAEQEVVKYSFKPFPAGDYELKLLGETVDIRTSKAGRKYLSLGFQALGTAKLTENSNDSRVYHMLFLGLTPDKRGKLTPNRADQLKGLLDALGEQRKFAAVPNGGGDMLDIRAISKFLKEKDGEVVEAHVRIQKGDKDYPNDKNVIDYFIAADEAGEKEEEGDEDEELEDDEDSELEDNEEDDEELEDEEEDDEDDKPRGKVAKKAKRK